MQKPCWKAEDLYMAGTRAQKAKSLSESHKHITIFFTCFTSILCVCRQACRGDKHDDPVTACDAVDNEVKTNELVVDASAVYTLPAGADFIMCYSVAEGKAAGRIKRTQIYTIQSTP